MAKNTSCGVQLRIRGKVQGVGFRPFVWQLAQQLNLHGEQLPTEFTIRQSAGGAMNTQIVPDAATCPACLAEMNTPGERRYRYPFINCTHCGPRFTIIRAMPYDRPFTVMAAFPLCPACDKEYRDPLDRRFHAHAEQEAALQAAIAQLKMGNIVAIKGIGGFHLACDARNSNAVATLRARKHRPAKPLAVMLPVADGLPDAARQLLTTPAAPIVLVDKKYVPELCDDIAPDLNEVGVMLPANPLQHLLLQELQCPLVMTSGNLSGKPPAISNEQALADLQGIADGFLIHNRDIVQRMDDSVVRESGEMLRRSRGYVPDALVLPPGFKNVPPVLCLGADLKNTFCLVRGEQAVLSQHLGDLSDDGIQMQWREALRLMQNIYDFTPQYVVHDEWPLDGGDVIALTLDGIGMGENGALWGGECLRVNYRECEHLGGLPAVALPGGDLAAKQPWRNLLAQCLRFVPEWQNYSETASVQQQNWSVLARAIERGINAPLASSCGRLFDAVAAALGCAPATLSYEGEAACALEALAASCHGVTHPVTMPLVDNQLDLATFWQQWLNWQAPVNQRAWAFHDALAQGFAALMREQATMRGITTLVFSGGVIHNRLLRARLAHYLADFTLLFPQSLPAGDGGLSLGQGVIAAARWLAGEVQNG
ncbi:MAG: carbamoyltransferase HypF [Escherichia coli]|nr:carbamoyltransferase HypF [Escherichia coli]